MGTIRLGCSGWDYRDWVDIFYESGYESKLQACSRIFNTPEINSIEDKTKIFLDFGKNFAKEKQYFEEPFIKAREESHLLELGILPSCLQGLYEKEEGDCDLEGVFISHSHTDHYDSIRFLKDYFPVYCGETAMNIILARELSGQSIGGRLTGDIVKDFSPIEVNPLKVHKFMAWKEIVNAPKNKPAWMPDKINKPFVKKIGIEKLEKL